MTTSNLQAQVAAAIEAQSGQEQNLERYMSKLNAATDYISLRKVIFELNEEKEKAGKDVYLFSFNGNKSFYDRYNELKTEFMPEYKSKQLDVVEEVEALISKTDDVIQLGAIKTVIRQNDYLTGKEITGPLYDAVDAKIQQVSKSA